MFALWSWITEFAPTTLSPRQAAATLSLAGLAVDRVEPAGDDFLLDLDLSSNRPDWLSHFGVARELAAVTGGQLHPPVAPHLDAAAAPIEITIEAGCGRYCAVALDHVHIAPAPETVAKRLEALGQRSINNLADLTNYTLWEVGQPTHAFDADKLRGACLVVRHARAGEKLTTLDGIERKLDPADLVIADAERPVALAGVMGGLETSITPTTRRVIIESAWFEPALVRAAARRHALHTDASHRFERGADPEAAPWAAALIATRALAMNALGAGLAGVSDTVVRDFTRSPIPLRPQQIHRILGRAVGAQETRTLLERLGCRLVSDGGSSRVESNSQEGVRCEQGEPPSRSSSGGRDDAGSEGDAAYPDVREEPKRPRTKPCEADRPAGSFWLAPSWRPDLEREIDLIEEVARLHGYERFPARLPAFRGAARPLPEATLRDRIRTQLRGGGFAEAVSLSFASETACRRFAPNLTPVQVLNPLSAEAAILRTSSLPAMLDLLRHNLHHGRRNPRLFELGKLYWLAAPGRPDETPVLSLGACDAGLDFRAFKGHIEAVLAASALPVAVWSPAPSNVPPDDFHPGRAARIAVDGHALGVAGLLHPALAAELKLPPETWLAEIHLAPLYAAGTRAVDFHQPTRFPASDRDFSFLLPDAVTWDNLELRLLQPPIPSLASLHPVEIFRDPDKIGPGHYSLLLRARCQNFERTLRDEEVNAAAAEIVQRLTQLGGVQR